MWGMMRGNVRKPRQMQVQEVLFWWHSAAQCKVHVGDDARQCVQAMPAAGVGVTHWCCTTGSLWGELMWGTIPAGIAPKHCTQAAPDASAAGCNGSGGTEVHEGCAPSAAITCGSHPLNGSQDDGEDEEKKCVLFREFKTVNLRKKCGVCGFCYGWAGPRTSSLSRRANPAYWRPSPMNAPFPTSSDFAYLLRTKVRLGICPSAVPPQAWPKCKVCKSVTAG
eukprot:746892-Pelagomonas_calceolata.AAC.1